ncbi:MAG: LemA family protein [Candidatus Colwellbacteria bacterium]|nr:LemA family protein [Candidatus Colwellbacteria bacterium]
MNLLTIIIIAVAVVVLWVIVAFNGLVARRMRVREALSDIDVQLKRRYDLIPNLIEAVKGYMQHERDVLENVTRARAMIGGGNPLERDATENALSGTLKTLFAVAENYPDLKADKRFSELHDELIDTEDKVQAARRFHNSTARDMNTALETFPSSIIARAFSFKPEPFFAVENEEERAAIKVDFSSP